MDRVDIEKAGWIFDVEDQGIEVYYLGDHVLVSDLDLDSYIECDSDDIFNLYSITRKFKNHDNTVTYRNVFSGIIKNTNDLLTINRLLNINQ